MRRSSIFFLFVFLCGAVLSAFFWRSEAGVSRFMRTSADLSELTSSLKLTDMSFSSDARYTRHPSQADLFSAFQDYPGSIEHFPSGSVTPAPDFASIGTVLEVRRK